MEHKLTTTEDGQSELTIRWDPQTDDPNGFLYGWIIKGHLDSFLRTFPQPSTGGHPTDVNDAYHLALGLNWLAELTDRRLEFLLLLLRDRYGASWGRIAAALEVSRSTAKSRYQRVAKSYAEHGHYVDESGLRSGPPAEVKALIAERLTSRDRQDNLNENAVARLKAGGRVRDLHDAGRQGTAVKLALGGWVIDWDDRGELLAFPEDIVPLG